MELEQLQHADWVTVVCRTGKLGAEWEQKRNVVALLLHCCCSVVALHTPRLLLQHWCSECGSEAATVSLSCFTGEECSWSSAIDWASWKRYIHFHYLFPSSSLNNEWMNCSIDYLGLNTCHCRFSCCFYYLF